MPFIAGAVGKLLGMLFLRIHFPQMSSIPVTLKVGGTKGIYDPFPVRCQLNFPDTGEADQCLDCYEAFIGTPNKAQAAQEPNSDAFHGKKLRRL